MSESPRVDLHMNHESLANAKPRPELSKKWFPARQDDDLLAYRREIKFHK